MAHPGGNPPYHEDPLSPSMRLHELERTVIEIEDRHTPVTVVDLTILRSRIADYFLSLGNAAHPPNYDYPRSGESTLTTTVPSHATGSRTADYGLSPAIEIQDGYTPMNVVGLNTLHSRIRDYVLSLENTAAHRPNYDYPRSGESTLTTTVGSRTIFSDYSLNALHSALGDIFPPRSDWPRSSNTTDSDNSLYKQHSAWSDFFSPRDQSRDFNIAYALSPLPHHPDLRIDRLTLDPTGDD